MKKLLTLAMVVAFGLATVTFTGCKKYDDGPTISLASKKARISGKWKVESETYNGTAITVNNNDGAYTEIDKDGTFTSGDNSSSFKGTWAFSSDKKDINVSYTVGNLTTTSSSTILKLKSKELWLTSTDANGNKTETHYVPF